jgi:putative transposon-encoded protein
LDKNAKKHPAGFQTTNSILKKLKYAKKSPSSKTEAFFTEEQVSVMMGKVVKIYTRSIKWYLYPQMTVGWYIYVTVKNTVKKEDGNEL